MNITKKILNKKYFDKQNQILKLSLKTYKDVNSFFKKVIIFGLPLIIIFPFLPLLLLDSGLTYYELVKLEKSLNLTVAIFFFPLIAIFVHRHIILKEEKYQSWYFIFGFFKLRYWKFILNSILLMIIFWSILMLTLSVASKISFILFLLAFPIGIYVQSRLSLCFPLIATNKKGWFIKSFILTKNLGLSLPLAYFAIFLPIIFFQALISIIITISDYAFYSDIIPIYIIGVIDVFLRLYTVSLLATFFSNVYLIVKEDQL